MNLHPMMLNEVVMTSYYLVVSSLHLAQMSPAVAAVGVTFVVYDNTLSCKGSFPFG